MIRYFKLAYDIIINNILFNLLIILEVTGMLVLTNTVIASYNSKQMLYLPYKDILYEKGVVFAAYGHEILEFSENKDVQAICERHKGNIDYRELTDLLLNNLNGDVTIRYTLSDAIENDKLRSLMSGDQANMIILYSIDHDIFEKFRIPLSEGRWASSEKNDAGETEAVISYGTNADLNKVYDTKYGKIKIVGILTQSTYIPPGQFTVDDQTEMRSIFDYYQSFDSTISLHAPFILMDQSNYPADMYFEPDSIWFISYGENISENEINANNEYLKQFGEIRSKYGDESFQTVNEKSIQAINDTYLRMLPMILSAAVVVLAGLIGSVAIATIRQKRNFGIFFLCGCQHKDCTKIIFAYLSILFTASAFLTVMIILVMKFLNMDGLIGTVYDWNNLTISFAEVAVMYILAVILPHHIIKTASPIEAVKENRI